MATCKETCTVAIALHKKGFTVKDFAHCKSAPKSTIYENKKDFKERGSVALKKASESPRKSSRCQDHVLKPIQL